MFDGQQFMFYDSGADSSRRIIAFATEEGLRYLARSTQWFVDGTFRTAPKLFHQLYIIRCPLGESAITCVYAFLSGKTQSIYEELFQAIVEPCATLGFNLDPTTITTDFELATVNAIRTVYGDHVQCHGCFFQLTQNTWRKIQELGFVTLYKTDEERRLFCSMLDALAFLPCDSFGGDGIFKNCYSGATQLSGRLFRCDLRVWRISSYPDAYRTPR
ncbi:uncharacterized protein LOC143041652 [Oratosquilla oratoria]|uniref:uncharacterized protein LOC143041652 n=1 Tax=Oratosquilla oratoria TaxID=337810 RepID=UPI003F774267